MDLLMGVLKKVRFIQLRQIIRIFLSLTERLRQNYIEKHISINFLSFMVHEFCEFSNSFS